MKLKSLRKHNRRNQDIKKVYNEGAVLIPREKIKTTLQTMYFSPYRLNYIWNSYMNASNHSIYAVNDEVFNTATCVFRNIFNDKASENIFKEYLFCSLRLRFV